MTNKQPTNDPVEALNKTLEENGKGDDVITVKDIAPEATKYHDYLKGSGVRDQKKYDRYRSAHLRNFYKYIAKIYPYLLFESESDELYFNYNKKTGVYEDWKKVHVQELVTREMINEGFLTEATISKVRQIIINMRAMFRDRGCSFDDFDNTDDWFHCSNGWVSLNLEADGKDEKGLIKYKDREFREHTPEMLSRRVSAVAYEAGATCPHYDKMMIDFQLKDDMVRVIDQFSGLLLTGEIKHQKMLAFVGKPGCGKSTIAETWGKVLGEMAIRKDLSDLTGDRFRFIGKSLTGRTFLHFDEVDIKRSEMGSNLGNLITGDRFAVERKGKDEDPSAKNKLKCVLTANSLPMSAEVGIFRRMILIEFNNSLVDAGTADLLLPEKLEKESSGILNRMLLGLADIQTMGTFTVIEGHDDAIEDYKVSSNTIAEYLEEYYEPGEHSDRVPVRVMFNTYVKWLGQNRGRMTLTPQRFGQMLKTQPLKKFDITSCRGTGGLRVNTGVKIKKEYKEDEFGDEVLVEKVTLGATSPYADMEDEMGGADDY
jgi:P4 family phage/plasmid primase-like protien